MTRTSSIAYGLGRSHTSSPYMDRIAVQTADGRQQQQPDAQLDRMIRDDALTLSAQLTALRAKLFPPRSTKTLRRFTSGEAASLIGVTDAYLRQLSLAGLGPEPELRPGGRRSYSLAQVNALRQFLSSSSDRRSYSPRRVADEPLDRKSTRLNSSHANISYAAFCL